MALLNRKRFDLTPFEAIKLLLKVQKSKIEVTVSTFAPKCATFQRNGFTYTIWEDNFQMWISDYE
jgi:hypothetical protein